MATFQRLLMWVGTIAAIALVSFVCIIYGYWEHFTVTAEEHTTFVQYGSAVPLRVQQAASGAVGASALLGVSQSAARSTP